MRVAAGLVTRCDTGVHQPALKPLVLPCQARLRAISEIVAQLVAGVNTGKDVDLNQIKRQVSTKFSLARAPKLVEIIAALPEEHKASLLPKYVLWCGLDCVCFGVEGDGGSWWDVAAVAVCGPVE